MVTIQPVPWLATWIYCHVQRRHCRLDGLIVFRGQSWFLSSSISLSLSPPLSHFLPVRYTTEIGVSNISPSIRPPVCPSSFFHPSTYPSIYPTNHPSVHLLSRLSCSYHIIHQPKSEPTVRISGTRLREPLRHYMFCLFGNLAGCRTRCIERAVFLET